MQTAGISYLVLVSACAIPFLLITKRTEDIPPNHHTAGNLVNLSRGTCRSKGQGVLMRRCLFFIHNRIRKLQPDVNQKEGRAFVRTSSDGASQTWILEPSDVKCATKSGRVLGMRRKAFLLQLVNLLTTVLTFLIMYIIYIYIQHVKSEYINSSQHNNHRQCGCSGWRSEF